METSTQWEPQWWKKEHTSTWERVKTALQRDWEQTKSDLHVGGHDLNQNVTDTVKQAVGKQEGAVAQNRPWQHAETAARYGVGARQHFGVGAWNDEIESKLKTDWENAKDKVQGSWDEVRGDVKRAFHHRLD